MVMQKTEERSKNHRFDVHGSILLGINRQKNREKSGAKMQS